MITCLDILNLKLDGVELIAGKEGLGRSVSWTYIVQTRPFEDHMNKGNFALIVLDDVRFDYESTYEVMVELEKLGISGMAISITNDEKPVPKKLIKKADELKLPLFYVRWEGATFVDIDQSIGNLILEDNIRNKRTGDYLYNLLWGYDINKKYIEKVSNQFGVDFNKTYRVGIVAIDRDYGVNLEQDEHLYEFYTNQLIHEVTNMECRPMYTMFLNMFVLLFEVFENKKAEHEIEEALVRLDNDARFVNKISSTCILGRACSSPREFNQSYREAKSLILRKNVLPNPKGKKVLSASAMGIYQFLFNSGNQQAILEYCNAKLHALEEYDHANGTFLQETLVEYYMNGFNNSKTAEKLFIHRNSFQHRLDKIAELLEIDSDDYAEYLELINCILIKRMIYL